MIPLLAAPDFMPALPEIFLGAAAMALLLLGVHQGDRAAREILWLSVGALAIALALVLAPLATHGPARQVSMFGMFVTDGFGAYAKVIVLLGAAFSLVIALAYNDTHGLARPEYPVLVLFGTAGMMMMISANDLIALYLALELQSLSLYVLASYARDSDLSTEAGLKYFVLGALASGMLLYGASLVYGFAGSTNFDTLAQLFANGGTASVGLVVGIVFIAVGLAFKCSAVPFHMWTPDVYQGAPTPVTAFFSVAPKTAAIVLFVRVMVGPFGGLVTEWRQVIWFIAVASMLLGAFAAINQRNIKRLMAYSSIGHVGYALIGLAAGTPAGVRGVLVYMAIYLFMNIGTFAVILCMKRDGRMIEQIDDLAGLSRTQPALALALAIFMFSMAGIPPLAGFFAKIYVFLAAIDAGLYALAVIGVLASVVGAYYYLRIVKLMYFDEPVSVGYDRPIGREMQAVLLITAVVILFFFAYPGPVVDGADQVAAALFAG
jgi:NADH-quinone oxidoreductase subunit N